MLILALAIFGAISISPAAAQTYDTGCPPAQADTAPAS
jgi:hypothetical protein